MSAIVLSDRNVVTRKSHMCFGCLRTFPKGMKMHYQTNIYDGSFCAIYSCPTCDALMKYLEPSDEGYEEGFVDYELSYKGAPKSPEDMLAILESGRRA
jgi:hypothetical protein